MRVWGFRVWEYLRIIDIVYDSALGLSVIKKRRNPLRRRTGPRCVQGYLAHKKTPPPQEFRRALGIGLL